MAASNPASALRAALLAPLLLLLLILLLAGAPRAAEAKPQPRSMQSAADEETTCVSCVSYFNAWSPKDKRCYYIGSNEDGMHGRRLPAANMWLDMAKKDPKLLVRDRKNCPGMPGMKKEL